MPAGTMNAARQPITLTRFPIVIVASESNVHENGVVAPVQAVVHAPAPSLYS